MKSCVNFNYAPRIPLNSTTCQEALFISLNSSDIRVLNQIAETDNKFGNCFINQTTIAARIGLTREQVNRIIAKLCRYGFITKVYRHMKSCIYELSRFMRDPVIRTKYRHKMRAFRYLSVIMLYASLFISNVTHTIQDIRNLYKTVIDNQGLYRDSNCKSGKRSPRRMYSTPERSEFILKLTKEFNLTKKGQIELTPYPLEALKYAHEKLALADMAKIAKPFSFFLSWSQVWCTENAVTADHGTKLALLNEHQIPQWMSNQTDRQLLTEQQKRESDIKFHEQHTSFMKLQDKDKPMYGKSKGYQKRESRHQPQEWQGYNREQRFESMAEVRARKAMRAGDLEAYSRHAQEPDWINPYVRDRVIQMTRAFYHTPEEIERLRQELGQNNRTPRGIGDILATLATYEPSVEEPKNEETRPGRFNIREYLARSASPDIPRPKEFQHLKPED